MWLGNGMGLEWAALLLTGVSLVTALVVYAVYAWGLSRVFPHLGDEAWRAWVPVLNESVIFARGGVPAWNVVFYFFPLVNLYALYLRFVATGRINAVWGRGTGTTVLAVLVPPVWSTVLALASPASASTPVSGSPQPAQPPAYGEDRFGGPAVRVTPGLPLPPTPPETAGPAVAAPSSAMALSSELPGDIAMPRSPELQSGELQAADLQSAESRAREPRPVSPYDSPLTTAATTTPSPVTHRVSTTPAPVAAVSSAPESPEPPVAVHNPWAPAEQRATSTAVPATTSPGSVASAPVPASATPDAPAAAAVAVASPTPDAPSAAAVASPWDGDDEDGSTVVVDRRPRLAWHLTLDDGTRLSLTGEHVLLGRKPVATASGVQPLVVPDESRTLSKVHARLDLQDGQWSITDLNSTNGVVVTDSDGGETVLDAGVSVPVTGRILLGNVGMRIEFEEGKAWRG